MDTGGKRMRIKSRPGIRKRIIVSFGAIVIATVIVLEIFFVIFVQSYYYKGAEQILKDRVNISADFLNRYLTYSSAEEKARFLFENNISSYDNKFLVQVIDSEKTVIMDSNGFSDPSTIESQDVFDAFENKISVNYGESPVTKESVMSASRPLMKYNNIDGVIRYTVSLEKVNKEVRSYIMGGLVFGAVLIAFFMAMATIVSKSIVNPIQKLNETTKRMALGDFEQRAEKVYDDEVGQLTDTVNFMAEEIIKTDKLKTDFISSISHELRTPLTSIKGWSETLMLSEELDQASEMYIGMNIISSEADRLKDMVEELLDFSSLESNKMKVKRQNMDPKKLLKQVCRQFYPRAKTVTLECETLGENTMVMGDANRLRQVFINLLANSFKFTPSGGSIKVRAEGFEDRVVISVADSGIGISEQDLPKVRDKFFKGAQTSPGSGLGLSIVDEILKLHDAKMEIKSEIGHGTEISITIPGVTKHKKETDH